MLKKPSGSGGLFFFYPELVEGCHPLPSQRGWGLGNNIRRLREMFGLKQDVLAYELGEDWKQQKISLLEQKETIDEDLLAQVAKVVKVPVEAIKNFDESSAINIMSNTFSDFKDNAVASAMNYQCSFNPIDKIVEFVSGKD